MKIPEHPTLIANDTILLNETEYPIIRLEVVPGKFSDRQMTKFNWTFVDNTAQELLIQLNYEHISYISSKNTFPDSIQATIYGV